MLNTACVRGKRIFGSRTLPPFDFVNIDFQSNPEEAKVQ